MHSRSSIGLFKNVKKCEKSKTPNNNKLELQLHVITHQETIMKY